MSINHSLKEGLEKNLESKIRAIELLLSEFTKIGDDEVKKGRKKLTFVLQQFAKALHSFKSLKVADMEKTAILFLHWNTTVNALLNFLVPVTVFFTSYLDEETGGTLDLCDLEKVPKKLSAIFNNDEELYFEEKIA